jgi:lipoate synthase
VYDIYDCMKLLKTILKLVNESEKNYNQAIETFADEKTLTRLEKKYQDSLKLMETFKKVNGNKENYL